MALVNTLVVDLVTQTIVLTSSNAGLVETITYSNALKQVTFAARAAINITGAEFIDLVSQINILQTAILFNFSNNINETVPFNSFNLLDSYDSGANTWNLVCLCGSVPRVFNYSGIGSNSTVDFLARANSKTIEFPEWMKCLQAINSYRTEIRDFFNL